MNDLSIRHLAPLDGQHILVTGASGLVGGYLARALVESSRTHRAGPSRITLICRRPPTSPSLALGLETDPRVRFVFGDVSRLKKVVPSADCIVHAASPAEPSQFVQKPIEAFRANVNGVQNLIEKESLAQGGRFLLVSTGEVYGRGQEFSETNGSRENRVPTTDLRSVYAESKRAAEVALMAYGAELSIKPVVARLFHTFGPGVRESDSRIFGSLLWAAARGQELDVRSNGTAVRSFLDLADTVRGLLDVLNLGEIQTVYNVGSDTPVTVRRFIEEVQRVCPRASMPVGFANLPEIDSYSVLPDVAALRNLGWKSSTNLSNLINRTVDWIRRVMRAGVV